jgi:hypothetical protein
MHLESRLSSLEQANRSLLEELVRLHSELKTESRRQEDVTAGARTDLAGLQHELGDLRNDLKAVIDRVTVDLLKRDEQLSNTLTYMKDMDGKMSVTVSELSGKQTSLLSRMAGVERGSERQFGEMWSELERVKTTSKDTQNLLTSVQRDMANHLHQLDSSCAAHNRRMAVADEDRSHLGSVLSGLQQRVAELSHQLEQDRGINAGHFAMVEDQVDQARVAIVDVQKNLAAMEKKMADRLSALEGAIVSGFSERDRQLDLLTTKLSENNEERMRKSHELSTSLQNVAQEIHSQLSGLEVKMKAEMRLLEKKAREEMMEEIGHTQSAVERKMTSLHSELRELDLAFQRKLDELEAVVKQAKSQNNKVFTALSDSIKLVQREGETSRNHLSNVIHAEVTVRLRDLDNLKTSLHDLKRSLDKEVSKLSNAQRAMEESHEALKDQLSRASSNILSTLQHTTAKAVADVDRRFRNTHSIAESLEQQLATCNHKVAIVGDELSKVKADIHDQFSAEQNSRKSDMDQLTGCLKHYLTLDEYHGNRTQEVEEFRRLDLQMNQVGIELWEVKRSVDQMRLQTSNQASSERAELKNVLTSLQSYLDVHRSDVEQGEEDRRQSRGPHGQDGDHREESGDHGVISEELPHEDDRENDVPVVPASSSVSPSEALDPPDIVLDQQPTGVSPVATPPPHSIVPRLSSTFVKYEQETEEPDNPLNQWGIYQAWRLMKIKEAWMKPLRKK